MNVASIPLASSSYSIVYLVQRYDSTFESNG